MTLENWVEAVGGRDGRKGGGEFWGIEKDKTLLKDMQIHALKKAFTEGCSLFPDLMHSLHFVAHLFVK